MRSTLDHRGLLEEDLRGVDYLALLTRLQREAPPFRQFQTWADVLAFMGAGSSKDPGKDEVLRPILAAHAHDRDPRWRSILLAIFRPGLESLHARKRRWDRDRGDRWQNTVLVFLRVVARLDLAKRSTRLAQRILWETAHRLHDLYSRGWRHTCREILAPPSSITLLAGESSEPGFEVIDSQQEREAAAVRLAQYRDRGVIKNSDYRFLVAAHSHQGTLADYARQNGLGYQAAKTRHQRSPRPSARPR